MEQKRDRGSAIQLATEEIRASIRKLEDLADVYVTHVAVGICVVYAEGEIMGTNDADISFSLGL